MGRSAHALNGAFLSTPPPPHRPVVAPVAVVGAENANRLHADGSVDVDAPDVDGVLKREPAPDVHLQPGAKHHAHVLVGDVEGNSGHGRGDGPVVDLIPDHDRALAVGDGDRDDRRAVLRRRNSGGEGDGCLAEKGLEPRVNHGP